METQEKTVVEIFKAIELVCKFKFPAWNCPDRVVWIIDEFLDVSVWISLQKAVEKGSWGPFLRVLQRLKRGQDVFYNRMSNIQNSLFIAAGKGDFKMVKFIHQTLGPVKEAGQEYHTMDFAAGNGNLQMLEWLWKTKEYIFTEEALIKAASEGHIQVVRWLLDQQSQEIALDAGAALVAACNCGHLQVVQYLATCCSSDNTREIYESGIKQATRNGHVSVVRWLYKTQNLVFDEITCKALIDIAILSRDLSVLKYIHTTVAISNVPLEASRCSLVVVTSAGALEVIKYCFHNNLAKVANAEMLIAAGGKGHLETLQYLYPYRIMPHATRAFMIREVVANGHLNIVKWLQKQCEFEWDLEIETDPYILDTAASSGQLHMIEWLYSKGATQVTTNAMDLAASRGHMRIIEWLYKTFDTKPPYTEAALGGAIANGHFEVAKWLHERGIDKYTSSYVRKAVSAGHVHILQWLHSIGIVEGINPQVFLDCALNTGCVKVVEWLYEVYQVKIPSRALDDAITNQHDDIVKWILSISPPIVQ